MATLGQVRGALFEEAVLYLLRTAGYQTVDHRGTDPTLSRVGAGLAVVGRGAVHQIDAIADYVVSPPFSHPQRLLVEAKCYSSTVELPVIRNTVGVIKDVSEFWTTVNAKLKEHRRYHYQAAVFSATSFSSGAEDYAFAHDIYLFPLANSTFFRNALSALARITHHTFRVAHWRSNIPIDLTEFRLNVRDALRTDVEILRYAGTESPSAINDLARFIDEVRSLGGVLVAMLGRTFPIFLVPARGTILRELPSRVYIRVHWNSRGWFLRDEWGRDLFSFDLPPRLFSLYARSGILTPERALQIKEDLFSDLQATFVDGESVRVIRFDIQPGWLEEIRNNLRQRDPGAEAGIDI